MANRKSLSDKGVAALKPRGARYAFPDPELRGHYVRVQPSGVKAFVAVARDPDSKQIWHTIGATDVLSIDAARTQARNAIKRVRAGLPPVEVKGETFGEVAANWLHRHVKTNGVRTRYEIERILSRHILPEWKDREFVSIRRSDIASLLDDMEDQHGARQADYALGIARNIANWYAARNDDYQPPFVRGMRRQKPHAQARARILTDDEIRTIWKAAEGNGAFGGIVRLLLLSAQRKRKVATIKWADISDAGEWTIPREPREKDNAGMLVLPSVALAIVRAQQPIADNPYVFAGRGGGSFNGFSKAKRAIDAKVPNVKPWVLHDLRRSARSLMSRAGVRPDVAERVLGHAIVGVEGVYDRHKYRDEKADALRRLAGLVETILNPPKGNVRPMRRAAR